MHNITANHQHIWQRLMAQFRAEYGDTIYRRWFMDTNIAIDDANNTITLYVEHELAANQLPQYYGSWLQKKFTMEGLPYSLSYQLSTTSSSANNTASQPLDNNANNSNDTAYNYMANRRIGTTLNKDFSFNNFIVGPANELAVNICQQTFKSPHQALYNPIAIYGEVGIGKTHLLHAIGLKVKEQNPKAKILYLTAENFVQNFVESIKYKDILSFKSALESNDILLLDDLHFMIGKEGSIQQLTSIITIMIDAGKQIIIAADRPADTMHELGERLRSRICQGITLHLQQFTEKMREDIIRTKARLKGMTIPESAINVIAGKVNYGGARQLEGVLNKLQVFAQTERRPLSPQLCYIFLDRFERPYEKKLTVDEIQRFIAQYYEIKLADIISTSRRRDIARPRQLAMYLAKKLTTRSLPDIGRRFKRDHTTVIHAVQRIEGLCAEHPRFKEEVDYIKRNLMGL